SGQLWEDVSPSIPSEAIVQDVEFIDFNMGWILWTTHNDGGDEQFSLAHTIDHGVNWSTNSFSLFAPDEIPAQLEEADMGWFDAQIGWIAVKQMSGSNFSLG